MVSDRPYDLANPVLRVNQYYCLGGQLLRRASPPSGEIAPDDFGRVCTGFDPERAPEKIYAPAGVTRRITWVSAELRRAEVPRSAPPGREGPVIVLGIKGPDVEVLNAVMPVT